MRIANTISDSIVDGAGLRFTVFTQGCPHHCPDCHNPDTHDPRGGEEVTPEAIMEQVGDNPLLQGLTISGGEPFLQPAECAALAALAHQKGLDVWVYSGYTYEVLCGAPEYRALLDETDVLVDGPFVAGKKSYDLRYRGSANQRLIDMKRTRAEGKLVLWEQADSLAHFTRPPS
ncbi:MAG: anaerobic ribonucleoside-triphosphate reductase activating protein [Oscillospiraceae bacterium]|nr:anaerobic ribonucleoside-triphosphate reductase activating protein [Oscillospiraceae bacterium]